eukprot:scaffold1261_cov377-Prasinococcus_capsulatus_cf.AAC.8
MSYTSTSRSLGTACGNSSFVQARSARLSGALRRPTPAVSHSTSSTGTHRARRLLVHAASAADLSKYACPLGVHLSCFPRWGRYTPRPTGWKAQHT